MNKKKINAYFVIAFLFLGHLIKKFIFKLKGSNVKQFKKNYYPEYLIELPKDSYEKLHEFETCINCSLCDAHCSKLTTFHRDGLPKISSLILSTSSSLEEYRFSDNVLDVFSNCDECLDPCITICPNEYPIFDLINVMKDYNKNLDNILENLEENNE